MEVIQLYILFALTTGITSCAVFLSPAIQLAKDNNIDNTFTNSTWLSYFIYVCITSFFAPFTVLPIFIPSFAKRFQKGLERAVTESQT